MPSPGPRAPHFLFSYFIFLLLYFVLFLVRLFARLFAWHLARLHARPHERLCDLSRVFFDYFIIHYLSESLPDFCIFRFFSIYFFSISTRSIFLNKLCVPSTKRLSRVI